MMPLNNASAAFEQRYANHLKHLKLQGLQTKTVDAPGWKCLGCSVLSILISRSLGLLCPALPAATPRMLTMVPLAPNAEFSKRRRRADGMTSYAATSTYSTWLAPGGTGKPSSRRPST